MTYTRRRFLKKAIATAAILSAPFLLPRRAKAAMPRPVPTTPPPTTRGPFEPSWDSLAQYECPEWFRDAKFGIWAHWSAQCVPEQGDWYARSMYQEGSGDYKFHCATYGHPSVFGFKDIDHIWHAENWQPEELIALYKAAGAKYFVALANHHDNFDTWDSKYQQWNTVNIGPQKDIIGTWAKLARANGLRFGVTVHASHTWDWLQVAQGADKTGPYAGVPYDGNITKDLGTGKWWEGYDPQDLYAQRHPVTENAGWEMEHSNPPPTKEYCEKFYNRTIDLIHQHDPDLIYFDDSGLPLHPVSDVGLRIAAEYYNHNIKTHGKLEGVLDTKNLDEQQRKCVVMDFERGRSDAIVPSPWQTDTCIGNWHYQRSLYTNHQYKLTEQVVRMLVDIVSKNGNLLLNIPVRGDGTIDPDEVAFLKGMAAWIAVNEEAIFATRPWKISGEGITNLKAGGFAEGGESKLTEYDFRFTTKGDVLYATSFGWPDSGKYTIHTLASTAPGIVGNVKSVSLLGSPEKLTFERTADGLVVDLPSVKPCDHAWALKIVGLDVAASTPVAPVVEAPRKPTVAQAADGSVTLKATQAEINGSPQLQGEGDDQNIGYWNDASATISWQVKIDQPGSFSLESRIASEAQTSFKVTVDGSSPATISVPNTGDWNSFQVLTGGPVSVAAGVHTVTVAPADSSTWKPMNLAYLKLLPVKK